VSAFRAAALAALVGLAVVAQVVVFRYVAIDGVVPDLALILVVVAAIDRGPQFAALLGFGAGLLLDLAPPADHVAGRWALALVAVGYLAGRMRQSTRPSAVAVVATVAASSFVGSSIFAISGLVLRDPPLGVPDLLQVILVAVGWDILLTPFVLPLVMGMFVRLEPSRTT
jgi:rod shape-determining protein MreD